MREKRKFVPITFQHIISRKYVGVKLPKMVLDGLKGFKNNLRRLRRLHEGLRDYKKTFERI